MKTATYIKLDNDVKKQAQILAARFGLSLSAMINVQLKQAVRQQRIELSLELPAEQMTPALEKRLAKIDKDIKAGKNMSRPMSSAREISEYLSEL